MNDRVKLQGEHIAARHNFELDEVFYADDALLANIVRLYDESARRSARSAQHAVVFGDVKFMRIAQWDEAVTQTFERILGTLAGENSGIGKYESSEFTWPERPNF